MDYLRGKEASNGKRPRRRKIADFSWQEERMYRYLGGTAKAALLPPPEERGEENTEHSATYIPSGGWLFQELRFGSQED